MALLAVLGPAFAAAELATQDIDAQALSRLFDGEARQVSAPAIDVSIEKTQLGKGWGLTGPSKPTSAIPAPQPPPKSPIKAVLRKIVGSQLAYRATALVFVFAPFGATGALALSLGDNRFYFLGAMGAISAVVGSIATWQDTRKWFDTLAYGLLGGFMLGVCCLIPTTLMAVVTPGMLSKFRAFLLYNLLRDNAQPRLIVSEEQKRELLDSLNQGKADITDLAESTESDPSDSGNPEKAADRFKL